MAAPAKSVFPQFPKVINYSLPYERAFAMPGLQDLNKDAMGFFKALI
jgi:hypothetical protein